MSKSIYLFVDVETTGKNFHEDGSYRDNDLLQVAYLLCDDTLNITRQPEAAVVRLSSAKCAQAIAAMSPYVHDMHTKTGLIDKLQAGGESTYDEIDDSLFAAVNAYKEKGYRIVPAGNNVQFDVEVLRRYLPKTFATFHYSFLDVTSARRMCELAGVDAVKAIKANKASNHDACVDVIECAKEARAIRDIIAPVREIISDLNTQNEYAK